MKSMATLIAGIVMVASLGANADLISDYGWEDGEGTVLGLYGTGEPPIIATNVGAPDPVFDGDRSLRLEDNSPTYTPEAFVAWITDLEAGDVVEAGFWRYDDTPGSAPSCRIWGVYTTDPLDIYSYGGSAGGNEDYGAGVGWEYVDYTWIFDPGYDRTGLRIVARTYSNPGDTVWLDGIHVVAPDHATIHLAPEPTTLALLALATLTMVRRRR